MRKLPDVTTTNDWTRILGWPGYRVNRSEIDETSKRLKLWARRRRNSRGRQCSGCGRWVREVHEVYEREVRDLPWAEYRVTVVVELYRVRCPDCGIKVEKTPQLPSKAPFSLRFEDEVGRACEGAAAAQVARRLGMAANTVRAIDLRYLERWAAARKKPRLRQMGVDEIYLGKKRKFVTVVSNLELCDPVWFGKDRKQETLDAFFTGQLTARRRSAIEAACMDMWEPFRASTAEWAPQCRTIYDKFHVMQHANRAVDEVRRAEFFRKGREGRELVKGKRWLLLTRWVNLSGGKRQQLNTLFALNRRLLKAYLLKESLDRLWSYTYESAMLRYLGEWTRQLNWQRLQPFHRLANLLHTHLQGILNYCRTKVRLGVVEAVNGNIKTLLRRGRGYSNLRYLLLKAQRMAATRAEFVALRKAA